MDPIHLTIYDLLSDFKAVAAGYYRDPKGAYMGKYKEAAQQTRQNIPKEKLVRMIHELMDSKCLQQLTQKINM
ncbi:MAG: hypothetical protein EOM40_17565 [Clostridia bacterium]|nr:hypothetical protein [Clostridia bacterium]NCC43288.1 hypothetical protein [Clostridia bacterium]